MMAEQSFLLINKELLTQQTDTSVQQCGGTMSQKSRPKHLKLDTTKTSIDNNMPSSTPIMSSCVSKPLDVGFNDLTYSVKTGIMRKEKKLILNSVSGDFLAGDLTAIMGASGSGKSTLMNILAGYSNLGVRGSLTVNGITRDLKSFRADSCYIMQDDKLQPLLTVQEAMNIAANLKLGVDLSWKEKDNRIKHILEAIGLKESRKTKTMHLSGGQRKRLAIALELIRNPPVMFFDEPTSGLDSATSKQCVALLKQLAQEGRTIICTIHQPSALLLEMFDHLYTIANGSCIYQGSIKGLIPYLSELNLNCPAYHNPADYFLEVATGEYGDHLESLVRKSENGKNKDWRKKQNSRDTLQAYSLSHVDKMMQSGLMTPVCAPSITDPPQKKSSSSGCWMTDPHYPTTFVTQFSILLQRTVLILSRDRVLTYTRFFIHLVIAACIGVLYFRIGEDATYVRDNFNYIFFSVMFLMFTSFNSMTLTFPLEIPIVAREHFNRWYSVKSYYLAVSVADVPVQMLCTVLYAIITFLMTSQPFEPFRLWLFVIMCVLVSLVAQSFGLLCGSIMNIQNGLIFGSICILPFTIFSGFFVQFHDIHPYLRWLFHTSFIKHGFEGMMLSIFGYNRSKMKCSSDYCHFKSPSKFLSQVDMEDADYSQAVMALVTLFIIIRVVTYIVLMYKLRHKRSQTDSGFIHYPN